jgi:hypothetical protein
MEALRVSRLTARMDMRAGTKTRHYTDFSAPLPE